MLQHSASWFSLSHSDCEQTVYIHIAVFHCDLALSRGQFEERREEILLCTYIWPLHCLHCRANNAFAATCLSYSGRPGTMTYNSAASQSHSTRSNLNNSGTTSAFSTPTDILFMDACCIDIAEQGTTQCLSQTAKSSTVCIALLCRSVPYSRVERTHLCINKHHKHSTWTRLETFACCRNISAWRSIVSRKEPKLNLKHIFHILF